MEQNHNMVQSHPIKENLTHIHQRIKQACKKSGRNPEEIRLMLVTKTIPLEHIKLALDEGEKLLGENTLEELVRTSTQFHNTYDPEIHFIGHLRIKDLEKVLKYAHCIQTVDRIELAREMNTKLQEMNKKMDVLIQVNTSRKESKYGISAEHAIGLVLKVAKLPNLRIRGLMTLGLFGTTEEKALACYQLLKNLSDEIKLLNLPDVHMDILSMGMSDHLETAIEEGSTMIRVGTAIFGERNTPDSYYWKDI